MGFERPGRLDGHCGDHRKARKEAGITQAELADLAGTSERTVRAIETATGNPSLAAVEAVANAVGLHLVAC
jgi:putative transcriptional regulator